MNRRHLLTGAAATAAGALLPLPPVMAEAARTPAMFTTITNHGKGTLTVYGHTGGHLRIAPGEVVTFDRNAVAWVHNPGPSDGYLTI